MFLHFLQFFFSFLQFPSIFFNFTETMLSGSLVIQLFTLHYCNTCFVRAFSFKRTKVFLLNLWKDDRPRKGEPKDINALDANKIQTSSEFEESKKSKKPGIRGDDETFQVASTSRAPLEAELFKLSFADVAGNRFDFKNTI